MYYLAVAVAVVGGLCLVDLLLTVAVIRRLRDHTLRLRELAQPDTRLPIGTATPAFQATTVDSGSVDTAWLGNGSKLVVLMSATCSACQAQVDRAARYAEGMPGGADDVLAVLVGDGGHVEELTETLRGRTTLVREARGSGVSAAFAARAFPTYYLLREGRITSATHVVDELPVPSIPARA